MAVDTGSANLILNSPQSAWCQSGNCEAFGSYNAASSKTEKWVDDEMQIQYEVAAENGSWVLDDVHFAGKVIPQLSVGTGNGTSTNPQNFWGFGYLPPSIFSVGIPSNDSTLRSIANAGLTNSASMSIYLNETGSTTGSILFGGLDTSLYTGDLQTLPIVPRDGVFDRVAINVSSISLINGTSSTTMRSELPARMVLDTGNFDIKIPFPIAQDIQSAFGITTQIPVAGLNFSLCECSLADNPAIVSFGFGSVNIKIPMKSLVLDPPAAALEGFGVNPSSIPAGSCLFLINSFPDEIVESGEFPFILGGAFLSNAYMILDVDAQEITLGQANFHPGPSHIQEIASSRQYEQQARSV